MPQLFLLLELEIAAEIGLSCYIIIFATALIGLQLM